MNNLQAPILPNPIPKKLNVGCGWDKRPGFLNVDLHSVHLPDLISDVCDLHMLPNAYFDIVVAQDILEHLERGKIQIALQEWSRLLSDNGILKLRIPSLMGMFELLSKPENRVAENAEDIIHLMYGTQAYNGDYHLCGFTAETLVSHLKKAGLTVSKAAIKDGWLFDVEARKLSASLTDEEFIQNAYFDVLGRPVDQEGFAHMQRLLSSGEVSRESALKMLENSSESKFLKSNSLYVLNSANHTNITQYNNILYKFKKIIKKFL